MGVRRGSSPSRALEQAASAPSRPVRGSLAGRLSMALCRCRHRRNVRWPAGRRDEAGRWRGEPDAANVLSWRTANLYRGKQCRKNRRASPRRNPPRGLAALGGSVLRRIGGARDPADDRRGRHRIRSAAADRRRAQGHSQAQRHLPALARDRAHRADPLAAGLRPAQPGLARRARGQLRPAAARRPGDACRQSRRAGRVRRSASASATGC